MSKEKFIFYWMEKFRKLSHELSSDKVIDEFEVVSMVKEKVLTEAK